jgi:hypothetical protein
MLDQDLKKRQLDNLALYSTLLHLPPFRLLCLEAVLWIRIRIGSGFNGVPESVSGSGSRRAKMTHKQKKVHKLNFLKCWMFFLGQKASPVAWT